MRQREQPNIEFEHNWFKDRTQCIWEKHLAGLSVDRYLEIGVNEGASMRWVLETLQPTTAVGVDSWTDPRNKNQARFAQYKLNCEANLKPWIENNTLQLIHSTSLDYFCCALMDPTTEPFDLIYIDGDHGGYEGMLDMLLAYKLLAKDTGKMALQTIDSKGRRSPITATGGIMVIDDLQRKFHFGKPLIGTSVWMCEWLMMGRLQKLWEDGRQCAFVRIS